MVFKPIPCRTRWEGLAAAAWLILIDLLLINWAWQRPTDTIKFVLLVLIALSIPVLVHIIYRTWAVFTLEYWLDRNAVVIRWANTRQIIPLALLQHVIEEGVVEVRPPGWLPWPMPQMRRTQSADAPVLLCATLPLAQCLILNTGERQFAISPAEKSEFLAMLQECYRLGPVANLQVTEVRASVIDRFLGENRVGLLLIALGLVGVLALFGRLMVQFPSLPSALPFRYSSAGLPEVVRDKSALFILPAIGLLAWLVNGLWGMWMMRRQQPTGAYMLWGGAIAVQVCSLLALNSLLR
jgi:hypothetical protein